MSANDPDNNQLQPSSEVLQMRQDKLDRLRQAGIEPFGGKYERTHTTAEILHSFQDLEDSHVKIAGRLVSIRTHGKASFADLDDGSERLQVYVRVDHVGEQAYELFSELDIGDIIGVEGRVFRTRRGQISVEANVWTLLTKSLRPLPEKWHGLRDVDLRYRQRYLDLIVNKEVNKVFRIRSLVIQAMRSFLVERGFLEVETPMLHPIPGGAVARPFVTHHNTLDMDLYLRIAPELYLKRLLVGGFDKVFELGKNFRNEGISTKHNPEYTSVEIYEAYADMHDMMKLTEDIFAHIAQEVQGTLSIEFQGQTIDVTPPWKRMSMLESINIYAGVELSDCSAAEARNHAKERGLEVDAEDGYGSVVEKFFDRYVEPQLIQPVFITDHPVEVSPLAKRRSDRPELTERFEPFLASWELANGFSELTDPLDQAERFRSQAARRAGGDEEAHMMDQDFVRALEHGMPPAGGLGIGVDRLIMLLTNASSIRDVLLFPHMRPRDRDG